MRLLRRPLRKLAGEIKTPPMSEDAREETGRWLRHVKGGITLQLPHSRPMPSIGDRVHELRINGEHQTWRVIYRIDPDAIIVGEVFSKKTPTTPPSVINNCQARLSRYDALKK